MKIKVMIAEDEKFAREELEYMLEQLDKDAIISSVSNGRDLLQQIPLKTPDVIFLDIEMPEIDGIEAAQEIAGAGYSPFIVFTTAYEQYAVDAFNIRAIDYLLKPFSEERLKEAWNRVQQALTQKEAGARSDTSSIPPQRQVFKEQEKVPKMSKLLIESGESLNVIDPYSILYVSKEERVVQLFTEEKIYSSKLTLQELEEKLKPFYFFRCHRSYLVNLNYIQEIVPWFNGAYNLILKDKKQTKLPVSRSAAKSLLYQLQM